MQFPRLSVLFRQGDGGVVLKNALYKGLALLASGVFVLYGSRLVVAADGTDGFAIYGLIVGLAAMLPFADLGLGAVLINTSAAAEPRNDAALQTAVLSCLRLLSLVALGITGIALVIQFTGLWPVFLGNLPEKEYEWVATCCMIAFAATLPIAVGQRLLVGFGKNHLLTLVQALGPPLFIVSFGTLLLAGAALRWGAFFQYLSWWVVAVVGLVIASRSEAWSLAASLRKLFHFHTHPSVPVLSVAGPMLIQMTALPLAMQSDRLLLSHLASSDELAAYNLSFQAYNLILQVIFSAGMSLWPLYASNRQSGVRRSPIGMSVAFAIVASLGAGLIALFVPFLADFVLGGAIALSGWLIFTFSVFVVVQAFKVPLGMYMTDEQGLRFQVIPILILLPLNVGLGLLLTPQIGAAGPVLASVVAVVLCQAVPNTFYVTRLLRASNDGLRS